MSTDLPKGVDLHPEGAGLAAQAARSGPQSAGSAVADAGPRFAPSIAAGLTAWALYTVLVNAVQASAGVPYSQWFATAANAWRVGVASLAAGTVLLLVFVAVVRWRDLWRDPVRLATTPTMKLAMLLWCAAIVLRLAGLDWARVPGDLLLAVLASGVLVGIAEELLFRGIFLRAMRAGGRSEAVAALWTAACFGLFHLPNVFMGTGAFGLLQVVLAGFSGVTLYVFRRRYGVLWPAMVAHGAWDISTFLAAGYAPLWLTIASFVLQLALVAVGIAVCVGLWRNDRRTVVFAALP